MTRPGLEFLHQLVVMGGRKGADEAAAFAEIAAESFLPDALDGAVVDLAQLAEEGARRVEPRGGCEVDEGVLRVTAQHAGIARTGPFTGLDCVEDDEVAPTAHQFPGARDTGQAAADDDDLGALGQWRRRGIARVSDRLPPIRLLLEITGKNRRVAHVLLRPRQYSGERKLVGPTPLRQVTGTTMLRGAFRLAPRGA
jgi:hypothetical protein